MTPCARLITCCQPARPRPATLADEAFDQALPPLTQKAVDARWSTATQLQTHALDRRSLATGQHGIGGCKDVGFRAPEGYALLLP